MEFRILCLLWWGLIIATYLNLASLASWRDITAELWKRRSVLKSWAISARWDRRRYVRDEACDHHGLARRCHLSRGWLDRRVRASVPVGGLRSSQAHSRRCISRSSPTRSSLLTPSRYLLISRRATVPGLYLWGFLTPPVAGADLRAALVANCFLGALPPVPRAFSETFGGRDAIQGALHIRESQSEEVSCIHWC